jgi:uroporphyrinogen-III synthase
MKDDKVCILSTTALSAEMIKEAATKNVCIDVIPFIKTQPVPSKELRDKIKNILSQPATVVFTSMNAVEAVATGQNGHTTDWNIYCIGTSTRKLVSTYFGEEHIAGSANSAAELANLVVEQKNTSDIIFFCGDQRREELPSILRTNNMDVQEVVVYETILLPEKVEEAYHGILFFSPSAVASFFSLNQLPAQTTLFAIGNTTAEEIKKYTSNKIIVGDEPGKENLLKKTLEYFS